jgi:hypothetical protein
MVGLVSTISIIFRRRAKMQRVRLALQSLIVASIISVKDSASLAL